MLLLMIPTSFKLCRHIFGLTNQDRLFLIYPENLNVQALLFFALENLQYLSEMSFFFLVSIPVLIYFLLSNMTKTPRAGAVRTLKCP